MVIRTAGCLGIIRHRPRKRRACAREVCNRTETRCPPGHGLAGVPATERPVAVPERTRRFGLPVISAERQLGHTRVFDREIETDLSRRFTGLSEVLSLQAGLFVGAA